MAATGFYTAVDVLYGYGTGHDYTEINNREREVMQGKNYTLAAMTHSAQYAMIAALFNRAIDVLRGTFSWPRQIVAFIIPILSLPFGLFAAAVKQGQYEAWVKGLDQGGYRIAKYLPRNLSAGTVKALSFYAEHIGTCLKVAFVISAVALVYLGSYAFGIGLAGAFAYQHLEMMGVVPLSVRLFMETYAPVFANIATVFVGGSLLVRIFSALQVASVIPIVNQKINYTEDAFIRRLMSSSEPSLPMFPSLQEYEAPLETLQMNLVQMNEVLDGKEEVYEINPAHCSKWAIERVPLPKDRNFEKLSKFFNEVDWKTKYPMIRGALRDDDRFRDFLEKEFSALLSGESPKKKLDRDFDELIGTLAQRKGQSVQQYAAEWATVQIEELVKGLSEKKIMVGEAAHLVHAQDSFSMIIPYLESLTSKVEKEDLLLKIAIEAGDYCARGVKRTSDEILNETVIPALSPKTHGTGSDQISYEIRVRQALQQLRHRYVEEEYQTIKNSLRSISSGSDQITNDVHGYDLYRRLLSLGFYPMTDSERNEVGMHDISMWNLCGGMRYNMSAKYKREMDTLIGGNWAIRGSSKASEDAGLGEMKFVTYMMENIETNPKLSKDDKEALLLKYSGANEGKWTAIETNKRFHRLMFVQLGILRRENQQV